MPLHHKIPTLFCSNSILVTLFSMSFITCTYIFIYVLPFAYLDNFLLPLPSASNSTPPFTPIDYHLTCNNFVRFLLVLNLQPSMCHPISTLAPMSLYIMMLCASLLILHTMVHTKFCIGRLNVLFLTSMGTRKQFPSIVASQPFLNSTSFLLTPQ